MCVPELWAPRGLAVVPGSGDLLVTDAGKAVVWQLGLRSSLRHRKELALRRLAFGLLLSRRCGVGSPARLLSPDLIENIGLLERLSPPLAAVLSRMPRPALEPEASPPIGVEDSIEPYDTALPDLEPEPEPEPEPDAAGQALRQLAPPVGSAWKTQGEQEEDVEALRWRQEAEELIAAEARQGLLLARGAANQEKAALLAQIATAEKLLAQQRVT